MKLNTFIIVKKASVVLALECLIVILSLVFHNILFLESIIFSQFTIAISLICGELKNYLQSDSLNGGKMVMKKIINDTPYLNRRC